MLAPAALLLLLAPPPAAQPTLIEGHVVDSSSKQPVSGARVILVRMDQPNDSYGEDIYKVMPPAGDPDPALARTAILTGIDGLFRFRLNAPATFMLFVEAAGYVRTRLAFGLGAPEYNLEPGKPLTGITLSIDAECTLSGRVLDAETRKGVAGMRVSAYRWQTIPQALGYRVMSFGGQPVTTDEEGRYELKGITPGEYYVQASPILLKGFRTPAAGESFKDVERKGYPRTFHPNASRLEEGSPVTLLPGAKTDRVDIAVARQRMASIRGRVSSDAGLPPGAKVDIALTELRHTRDSRTFSRVAQGEAAAGELFQLDNLPAGTYQLTASTPARPGETRLRAKLFLEVTDENLDALDLNVGPGLTLTGTVRLGPAEGDLPEKPEPLPETKMTASLLSTRSDGSFSFDSDPVNRETGAFSIPHVLPDKFSVFAGPRPKGYKIAEVRYNNALAEWVTFEVDPAADRQHLEIILRPASSSIQVTVTDGNRPVAGAAVSVVREPITETSLQMTARPELTDSEGRAAFKDLLAGKYRVIAFPGDALWRDDSQLPAKVAAAQQVVLAPSAAATVQIRISNP